MANDIIGSMFGVDPNKIAMENLQRAYQQNALMASQDPLSGGLMANVGSNIGMLGAKAMGLKTREEQVAENRQQIAAEISEDDPDSYLRAAQKAKDLGDTQAATVLAGEYRKAITANSKLAYEAALTAKANRPTEKQDILVGTTNKGIPVYADKNGAGQYIWKDGVKTQFSGKLDKYGNGDGSGGSDRAIVTTDDAGNITTLNPAGTQIRARFAGAGKPTANYEKEAIKLPIMEQGLQSIDDALSYLGKGIYTGSYANIQKNAAKLNPLASKEKAENTEAFLASIGNVVIPRLQEFGGSDSNEELKYLQKVTAGEITLEEGSIKKIMNDSRTKMNKEIARRKAGKDPTYPSKVADNSPEAKEARYQAWKAKQGIK